MSTQKTRSAELKDSRELVTMLEALSKEDRLQVQGVITGMSLARFVHSQQSSAPEQVRT